MNKRLWSLCVGIDSYNDQRISALQFAVADASAFHTAIVQTFDQPSKQSLLLKDDQATLREFRRTLGDGLAREVGVDDLVVIFFAGHGSPETWSDVDTASRYLVMHDTDYESIFATAVDLERDFVHLLERVRARQILILLDCCFSGAAGGRTFEGPELAQRRRQVRGLTAGLNQMDLGEGRVIISACDDWQVAREDTALSHGVFTFHLLKCLDQTPNEEPAISVLQLYDKVATEVARQTHGMQHPIINGRARLFRFPRLKSS